MRNLTPFLLALPLLGGALAGCGSSEPPAVTKEQENELRHPTHIPPPQYKGDAGAPANTPPPSAAPGGAAPSTTGG